MMPKMDGYEFCVRIRETVETSHIPIIMLTAKADMDSKIKGLEQGADAYLIKPFNKNELLVRIEKLIDGRQVLKQKYSDPYNSTAIPEKPHSLNEIFFQKIFKNLEKNYHNEEYGISGLCNDMGISRAQLHRKLIALTNKSASDFIRYYRIKKASEMMMNQDLSVSEIAYQVGFKDPNYFTKSFVKEIGMTPSEFRSGKTILQQ